MFGMFPGWLPPPRENEVFTSPAPGVEKVKGRSVQ